MQKIPIGMSDFEKIRQGGFYFVDKSMLVTDIVRSGSEVTLLPRPRRFGTTLNLSMLEHFFSMDRNGAALFEGLAVTRDAETMAHCGAYPTVFLTFKDIKFTGFEECLGNLAELMSALYLKHQDSLIAANPKGFEKKRVDAIINGDAETIGYPNALALLIRLLHRATGKKVIVLVDEYDMPIHAGFSYGYYAEIIAFMRNLLSGAFKDHPSLEKGVLTGIWRIAKESIFSGFNNLRVLSLLEKGCSVRRFARR